MHSVYEDFTWDRTETMSGAADDWAYEHLGIYGWTTEFWDIVHAATGTSSRPHIWYTGPTDDEALAVLRWLDEHATPSDATSSTGTRSIIRSSARSSSAAGTTCTRGPTRPPTAARRGRTATPTFAVAPGARLTEARDPATPRASRVGDDTWRVEVGVANTGWLPTTVSSRARQDDLVQPILADIEIGDRGDVEVLDGAVRRTLGQLAGSSLGPLHDGTGSTPDRTSCSWLVRAARGTTITVTVRHQRAGSDSVRLTLDR